jgi:Rrf2 family protein
MKLTKRGEYGLRVLIRLGIAQKLGLDVVSVSTLADSERLPFKFLEQILFELRHAGYLETKRGKQGGCRLLKPQEDIKIGEVVRLIDGRLAPIGCASETEYEKCSCPDEEHCGLRMLMIDVRNAIAQILDRYTLADVVSVTMRKMERSGVVLPFQALREAKDVPARARKVALQKVLRHADPADGFLASLGSNT